MTQSNPEQSEQTKKTTIPPLPPWPTSKPGPKVTEPPSGQKRVVPRTEQVVEINYDEEKGKSNVRREGE
jgi:hypothetical protein